MRRWLVLAGFVVLTLAVGRLGSAITLPALDPWYAGLDKPAFTPPDWAFPVAWTILYILMAVAAWLVWQAAGGFARARGALTLWAVQLALNLGWSAAFFGLRSPLAGLVVIALLLAAILATLAAFRRWSGWAAALLLPYLAWVGFASLLNLSIWLRNG